MGGLWVGGPNPQGSLCCSIVQTMKVRGETALGSKMLLHTKIVHAKFHALTHSFREIISLTKDLYTVAIPVTGESHDVYQIEDHRGGSRGGGGPTGPGPPSQITITHARVYFPCARTVDCFTRTGGHPLPHPPPAGRKRPASLSPGPPILLALDPPLDHFVCA